MKFENLAKKFHIKKIEVVSKLIYELIFLWSLRGFGVIGILHSFVTVFEKNDIFERILFLNTSYLSPVGPVYVGETRP